MSRNRSERDSTKQNGDQKYPGYPHYPSKEDITTPGNNNGKVVVNEEYLIRPDARSIASQNDRLSPPDDGVDLSSTTERDIANNNVDDDVEIQIVMGTEADVTEEDLQLLGPIDGDMDMGEDEDTPRNKWLDNTDTDGEPLNEGSGEGIASTGEDLDIPGKETTNSEDEENDYYSLNKNEDDNSTEGIP